MNIKDKIMRKFADYNSNLTVVAIYRFLFRYYVIAMHDPTDHWEMDPYYVYYPLTDRIAGFSVIAHLRTYNLIFTKRNLIYEYKK